MSTVSKEKVKLTKARLFSFLTLATHEIRTKCTDARNGTEMTVINMSTFEAAKQNVLRHSLVIATKDLKRKPVDFR